MTALADACAAYLEIRRLLGFKLVEHQRQLADLVVFLEQRGLVTLTAKDTLVWVCQPADAGPRRWARRLSMARGFAAYLRSIDPATETLPTRMWPEHRRSEPFVLRPAEIAALVHAAGSFGTPFSATTYQTIIGLLAVTGMRIGEALGLDDSDVDLDTGVLGVRGAKFNKSREVPLHPTTVAAITEYVAFRDKRFSQRPNANFFASGWGGRINRDKLWVHWQGAIDRAGVTRRDGRRPRLHDLRHSFAVNTLRSWHEASLDVQARLPLLSTYLGHANPASTYWYLTATPDLLAAAVRRLETGAVS